MLVVSLVFVLCGNPPEKKRGWHVSASQCITHRPNLVISTSLTRQYIEKGRQRNGLCDIVCHYLFDYLVYVSIICQ